MTTLFCRWLGWHRWMVRVTPFDLFTPMHVRYCSRCGDEQIIFDGITGP